MVVEGRQRVQYYALRDWNVHGGRSIEGYSFVTGVLYEAALIEIELSWHVGFSSCCYRVWVGVEID